LKSQVGKQNYTEEGEAEGPGRGLGVREEGGLVKRCDGGGLARTLVKSRGDPKGQTKVIGVDRRRRLLIW